jgi:hypothetical protein
MREASQTRSDAVALLVLVVTERLDLDWASRAPKEPPDNFVDAEWIALRDNPSFRSFVDLLRAQLDRVGPVEGIYVATSSGGLSLSSLPSSIPPTQSGPACAAPVRITKPAAARRAHTGQGLDRLPNCPHPVWSSTQFATGCRSDHESRRSCHTLVR